MFVVRNSTVLMVSGGRICLSNKGDELSSNPRFLCILYLVQELTTNPEKPISRELRVVGDLRSGCSGV